MKQVRSNLLGPTLPSRNNFTVQLVNRLDESSSTATEISCEREHCDERSFSGLERNGEWWLTVIDCYRSGQVITKAQMSLRNVYICPHPVVHTCILCIQKDESRLASDVWPFQSGLGLYLERLCINGHGN